MIAPILPLSSLVFVLPDADEDDDLRVCFDVEHIKIRTRQWRVFNLPIYWGFTGFPVSVFLSVPGSI